MFNFAGNYLNELLNTLRLVDILDIAIAAAIIYIFLQWVRSSTSRSANRRVLITAVVVATTYLTASFFEMYLVKTLVQVVLLLLLLGAVVVFQTDIRRMVDQIGSMRMFRSNQPAPVSSVIDVLTEAASQMAEMNRGALIALHGAEPWDRHIEGGIRLEGRASLPLLYSIFNPTSPGHDGAVLIEGEKIIKFGAHLPLSTRLPKVSKHGGTRHAAALGLAEQCDALVIVVSEERGVVSVARGNMLYEMETATELKEQLVDFWEEHYDPDSNSRPGWFSRHGTTALLALAIATTLWLAFAYRPDMVLRTFTVPIEYRNLKEGLALEEDVPTEARVTVSGSEQEFRGWDPTGLTASFDLSQIEEGENELGIAEENLRLPQDLSVYTVEPRSIDLDVYRQETVDVPIKVRTTGTLADSLELLNVVPEPDSVPVLVRQDSQQRPAEVQTEPVDLGQVQGSGSVEGRLMPPENGRLTTNQTLAVTVHILVKSKEK